MFRKPKNRNNRQRVRQNSDDVESVVAKEPEQKLPSPPPPAKSPDRFPSPDFKVNSGASKAASSLLSFDDDEGTDVSEFKVKKQDARKRKEKLAKKAQALREEEEQNDILKQKTDYENVRFTNSDLLQNSTESPESAPVFKAPEMDVLDEEEIMAYENKMDDRDRHVRGKFPNSFQDIPDAHAVYEARKKRERMRQNAGKSNDDGYIALNGEKDEPEARKHDSDSDGDDEGHGRFYSSKEEMLEEEKKRREMHMEFLAREQGDRNGDDGGSESEEDEEILRWEREMIKKGVSKHKMIDARQERLAVSGMDLCEGEDFEEEVMEIDAAITRMPARIMEPAEFIPVPIEQVLSDLRLKLRDEKEAQNVTEEDYAKVSANIEENDEFLRSLPNEQRKAEEKFRMLQEMKDFSSNIIECFDEKVPMINELEDQLFQMWKERNKRLIERRRQDLRDEYEACSSAAVGNTASVRSAEQATRAAERDARRSRRRLQRERAQSKIAHNEGLSSDDEETNSQLTLYKDTTESVVRQSGDVFIDVVDEFIDICRICDNFVKWLAVDEDSFSQAYISAYIPKLVSPILRHQLIDWNPLLSNDRTLSSMNWYKRLLAVGTDGLGVDMNHDEIVGIIPSVVQKCVLPRVIRLMKECYDPMSLQQSRNVGHLISQLVDDFPTLTATTKEVKLLLKSIHEAIKSSLEEDLFMPLFTRDALVNVNTGCAAFMNRQFWSAVKAIHCIKSFSSLFSEETIQTLILDGVVNRVINLALQCLWPHSQEAENVLKCREIIKVLPKEWFPARNLSAFRSLCSLFSAMAREYHDSNRSFSSELKKFVNAVGTD
ncbi:hypothetical protein L596_024734 [Steinernema carpocapsae]|uniref:GCF C-terminal domain-containing protein n=1 Tax=Steinernema carpocapsae TaxID=34508 RepID=A0A4U5M5R2_STECR|nr:hypothetical protein L596_024734 [Steinernema carpocapsae]